MREEAIERLVETSSNRGQEMAANASSPSAGRKFTVKELLDTEPIAMLIGLPAG